MRRFPGLLDLRAFGAAVLGERGEGVLDEVHLVAAGAHESKDGRAFLALRFLRHRGGLQTFLKPLRKIEKRRFPISRFFNKKGFRVLL
jgi:hypothetical protein